MDFYEHSLYRRIPVIVLVESLLVSNLVEELLQSELMLEWLVVQAYLTLFYAHTANKSKYVVNSIHINNPLS